jgi:threonine dehydrogenase-like Zn-dependent dehydrogenase
MQALVWTGPRGMEMQEMPVPTPAAGEVLLRVCVTGICGSDLSGYAGENSLRVPPLVMGHEFVGEVVTHEEPTTSGADVATFRPGQRVVVNPLISCGACDLCEAGQENLCRNRQIIGIHRPGGFAEYVAVPAAQCHVVPTTLSDAQAALTEPLACGFRAVAQGRVSASDELLILGAGAIGLLCIVAAREAGVSRITITDTSPERLAAAKVLGATTTIRADQHDVGAEVQQLTGSRGVAVAIDAVGLELTRRQAVRAVRPGGRAVFIGLHHETSTVEANYVVRQEIELVGAFSYRHREFAAALKTLAGGILGDEQTWIMEQELANGATIFADLHEARIPATKVTLRPRARP